MTVANLKELPNKRFRITLDDGFAFVLYKGELSSYGIFEGSILSDEQLKEITEELLPKRAKIRAMNLLKARPYTEKGLRDKLSDGDYPEEAITAALDYVKSFGYINDTQYALDYVNTYKDRKNRMQMFAELQRKGVDKDLIEQAFAEELSDDPESYEKEQILKFLQKKHYDPETATFEEREKILAALYRKGFSAELCRKVLMS